MPGAEFAQQRIQERFLVHRYTRVTRGQPTAAPADRDSWGQPVPSTVATDPDAGAVPRIPDLPCLYLAAGTYTLGPNGPIQTDVPTLVVPWDDPLAVGDRVEHIIDKASNYEYQAYAQVESTVPVSHAGPPIYQAYSLLEAEVV